MTGCRRFRRRSTRSWRDCWRKIRRRDISPSATFAAICAGSRSICLQSASCAGSRIVDRPATNDGRALIGREPERAQLLQSLHQARSGRGSLILLLGDAGVGKTRLAEDALESARRLGCQTLVGRCYEQQGTPALIAVHRSPRRGLSADAGRGVSPGDAGKRARAGEADARAASPVPRTWRRRWSCHRSCDNGFCSRMSGSS